MRDPQFPHVRVPGRLDTRGMGHFESGAEFLQEAHGEIDALLFRCCEGVPPHTELVGELYLPGPTLMVS